ASSKAAPPPATAPAAPRAPAASPEPAPAPAPGTARRRDRAPREKAATAPEPEAPPAAPAGPVLVVESDVPGASVFFNRRFLGTTPLRSTEVTAGAGQLNASAEGYDGIVQTVEVAERGPTEVTLRFKEVRLDASVAVVHKHGMGSCEGTLRATPAGLRYDTSNRNDAFTLGFGDLETFEVDYLQKNLKVKQRGGRTWNFTTKAANADPLFVFHRDVEQARAKLASR
ncbi:MAG: PEGA domain-containing protein, partial [Vicinamibacterales bacterium]|nr:PEGA domain-containing protein [Vicinamibacterales bacterium]